MRQLTPEGGSIEFVPAFLSASQVRSCALAACTPRRACLLITALLLQSAAVWAAYLRTRSPARLHGGGQTRTFAP